MDSRLKHRWSIGNNYLSGITAGAWWRLLREVRFDVDPAYLHRVGFISAVSVSNSAWALLERMLYHRKVAATEISAPPLFVLGHWRSGTTHLHNLICRDERFGFPNTYQVVSPSGFLCNEWLNSRLYRPLLPQVRPMDNVAMGFAEPQEDELALALLCLRSLYFGISFPRLERRFAPYLTFAGEPDAARRWQEALRWFVRKLTFKYGGRPVILKSPCHTARIRLILEVFPDARFVHIHRDPYTVFQSSQRYFDTATWYTYLQKPDRDRVDEEILQRYLNTTEAWFAQRDLVPAGHLHELAYHDLERDPLGELDRLYRELGLPEFEAARPAVQSYLDGLGGYRKNRHPDLSEDLRRQVAERWHRSFAEWGYPT